MENLLRELDVIENEHKDFFSTHSIKPSHYIIVSKKPVMIKFNSNADNKFRLPKDVYDKINKLIMSYYGL